ncbi:cupin domain-containing protein [Tateyamaria omphalii]|uniref:cupin domain-containing protein n=1 Tax=Tateyamaria omphalii TaxID=299262 RepID=UPI001C998305|nr:cupin domain-containing protein [Tateyamaria omphalii]MBY5933712.1 cupin domain-containing protein [Tateyamaria omphalii]
MELNADFTQTVTVLNADNPWRQSPSAGVERKMLDRIGDEVARATTIVRFAPGSAFAPHTHEGGEEYIVLEGVFQDEAGDFPVGTYVRNPPTSRHTPSSKPGATIFVKLWQFDPEDRQHVRVDMNTADTKPDPKRSGVASSTLFEDAHEHVALELWEPELTHRIETGGGAEILVLEGSVSHGDATLGPRDWLRVAPGETKKLTSGPDGARLWVKTGHLRQMIGA